MRVFFTVDVEFWPSFGAAGPGDVGAAFERDVLGRTAGGDYGLAFKARLLHDHGLTGSFFVEALHSSVTGPAYLREITGLLAEQGQDIQLHLHSEWLQYFADDFIAGRQGANLHEFSFDDQRCLIRRAGDNLMVSGAAAPTAFRAGNYGANNDTLRALATEGLAFDSSYNRPYLGGLCRIEVPEILLQPTALEGVVEFPVAHFSDWPGHFRHVQLTACSLGEIRHALFSAWAQGYTDFVMVSHSFELIDRDHAKLDRVALRRFEGLCALLAGNPDKFETRGFGGLDASMLQPIAVAPLRSHPGRTAIRMGAQLLRRVAI